jgi:hypothetical protein
MRGQSMIEASHRRGLRATVSEEVEALLARGTTFLWPASGGTLRPHEPVPAQAGNWKSGDHLWVVEVIAPFGGAEEMVKDLKANVHPGRTVKFLAMEKNGQQTIRQL